MRARTNPERGSVSSRIVDVLRAEAERLEAEATNIPNFDHNYAATLGARACQAVIGSVRPEKGVRFPSGRKFKAVPGKDGKLSILAEMKVA